MNGSSDKQIEERFKNMLLDYKDNGVVFQSPGGRAYYTVRTVAQTKAAVGRLSSNEDADV